VNIAALEQIMVRFSQLVVEQRFIKEIDINPMLASPDQIIALDARIVVFDKDTTEEQLPRLAVRAYPTKYVAKWTMKNGEEITIRPIRPEDEPEMVRFHETLSDRTVYLRYLQLLKLSQRVTHERLTRICFIDYDREIALVAERNNPETGASEIMAVARIQKLQGTNEAEFAIVLSDAWQGQGLGAELLNRVIQIARDEKIKRLRADILADNITMQKVCEKYGFRLKRDLTDPTVDAQLDLI
jgi:acetyltransferase